MVSLPGSSAVEYDDVTPCWQENVAAAEVACVGRDRSEEAEHDESRRFVGQGGGSRGFSAMKSPHINAGIPTGMFW